MELIKKLIDLFNDLRRINFNSEEKPSDAENLTDILEIVAVAADIKPTHLNGQGCISLELINNLEKIASRHDLLTLRTKSIKPYMHRKPNYDLEIFEWNQNNLIDRNKWPDILWIYKDDSLIDLIHNTVSGKINVSKVLGYPDCCVNHYLEVGLHTSELYVDALRRVYNVTKPEEIIELMRKDTDVNVDEIPVEATIKLSGWVLPYVQFNACPKCLKSSDSPSKKINYNMRNLAFQLSESFGCEIWKAKYIEKTSDYRLKNIKRNDPCPCCSGKKYKKCCGR